MSKDLKTKSDEELMESYQLGASAAFDILFQRHSGRVFGFLSKRLNQKKEAEDLLQEVFFKLHRSKHLFNATLPFSPWLFSITRSVLLDFAKKRNLEDPVAQEDLERIPSEEHHFGKNQEGDLGEKLGALPQTQRQAVSLRVYDEETFEEIALRLSTTPENARQLVSRGLKKLRQVLGRKEE
ncbi:MAG: sigma-70 family RNA polymerase sigma factor [Deltaproteobacteria bacterium]|nr:sigma-70 family RNA polymerase sigma factor [Deltaproteobacteria bacterium]